MKHLRKFEKYRTVRKREEIIRESVLQVNDIYKVRTMIDIPQSLINQYVKKVKDTNGKNLRQFFGDMDIAEEVVKYINTKFLNVDQIPAGALVGDAQGQGQTDDMQSQPQGALDQPQAQVQPQVQPQAQPEGQIQAQGQIQTQGQPQVQVQTESQPQGQVQAQGQGQAQPQGQVQSQNEFEEISDEDEDDEEESVDLPI